MVGISNIKPRLLFLITEDWYFCSHRLPLAQAAQKAGYDVWVATRIDQHEAQIRAEGFQLVPISMKRSSLGLKDEGQALRELVQIYRYVRPDIVHHVAMKPVLYGTLAAFLTSVPAVVNAMAGLGFVFADKHVYADILRPVVRLAFRSVLRHKKSRLILQNGDDVRLFIKQRLISSKQIRLIRGAGVDLRQFKPLPLPSGKLTIAMASRMIRDKGFFELVEAISILRGQGLNVRVILAGRLDPGNPTCLNEGDIRFWEAKGLVEWWGEIADVREIWAQAHIAALPSYYREGLPKCLLEAAACARPIVTTDAPGCREIVRHEENGLLVPVRDAVSLAAALRRLIKNPLLRRRMGARGREIVEKEFSLKKVISETLAVYQELLDD